MATAVSSRPSASAALLFPLHSATASAISSAFQRSMLVYDCVSVCVHRVR